MAFEHAERETDPDARAAWLTFVVIGGGPTGVEMAGTLAEIAKRTLPGEFRHIRPEEARVLLVEGGDRVLGMMPAKLGESAGAQLRALGVELQLNSRVTAIDATGVAISVAGESEPRRIASQCVIWGAGVAGAPLGAKLAQAVGLALARGGRVPVEPDLSVAGHPEISVIGDLAQAMSHAPGTEPQPVPGVSPAAKQMGRAAATNILRRIRAEATQPFRYRDYGTLATIGRNSAVVDLASPLGPIRFSGKLAWLFWLFAHIYFLIDFRAKAVVLFDWATAYWTEQRYARVVAEATRD